MTYRHVTRSCRVRVRSITASPSAYAYDAYITSQAIYLSLPASKFIASANSAWWSSIKTVNHETQNDNGVEGSRLRCPVLPASCRASTIFVSGPRAMRVGLKPSSALRALRRARRRRQRHRGPSFSFSPPAIPARHTSHHSINPPAGVHIQAHMVRHSPHPIHLRASCTVPRFCGLISSHLVHPICDSPASGGCRAAPIAQALV